MLMIIVNNGKVLEESLVCLFFPADISLGRIIIIMIKTRATFLITIINTHPCPRNRVVDVV